MIFESAFVGKNHFWRYLVMFLAAFLAANTIGGIPLIAIITIKTARDPSLLENVADNITDFSIYGIDPNFALILLIIPFIIGLLTFYLLIKPLNGRSFLTVINGGGSIRWGRFFYSALIWTLLMGVYLFISVKADPDNFTLNNISGSLIPLALIAIFLVPFQTTFEEVLFRGYLMQGVGVWSRNKWVALITTSVLFGLMHSMNPEIKEFGFFTMMPQYITFGFVFGLLVVLDNGIELAMGAHAANNAFLSLFVTQRSSTLQTPAIFEQHNVYPWTEFLVLAIASVLLVLILQNKYKWNLQDVFKLKTGD